MSEIKANNKSLNFEGFIIIEALFQLLQRS